MFLVENSHFQHGGKSMKISRRNLLNLKIKLFKTILSYLGRALLVVQPLVVQAASLGQPLRPMVVEKMLKTRRPGVRLLPSLELVTDSLSVSFNTIMAGWLQRSRSR